MITLLVINYQRNIRYHWGVENKLHWTLDLDLTAQVQGRKRVPSKGTNLLLHQREVV
jgi:hypothetical protein